MVTQYMDISVCDGDAHLNGDTKHGWISQSVTETHLNVQFIDFPVCVPELRPLTEQGTDDYGFESFILCDNETFSLEKYLQPWIFIPYET